MKREKRPFKGNIKNEYKEINIGVAIGTEYGFPETFIKMLSYVGNSIVDRKNNITYHFKGEYITIDPYNISYSSYYDIVLDRVSHWRSIVREWLKKIILDGVYVINNPNSIECKKKNFGYSAMDKLGFNIPETFMLPQKETLGIPRNLLEKFRSGFDLKALASDIGYPLYLKPYDGGGWRNVTKVNDSYALQMAYAASGTNIMTLQKGIEYDHFVRCICIGPNVLALKYDPEKPFHERYVIEHEHLSPELGYYIPNICRIINAFHGFDINTAEFLIKDGIPYLIDFNNPVPDFGIVSLHYYFPWILKQLLRYIILIGISNKRFKFDLHTWDYLDIANSDLPFENKVENYLSLAHEFFETDKLNKVSKEIFDEEYFRREKEFFESEDFENILKKEIFDSFHEERNPEKYTEFLELYKKLLGL